MKKNIGRFAVCGAGRIGKIEGVDRRGYYGTGIDGKPWVSRTPRFIKATQERFLYENNAKQEVVRVTNPREADEAIRAVQSGRGFVPPIFDPFEDGSSLNR